MAWRPKWRVFTWVIVVLNVLFLAWVISGVASTATNCNGLTGQDLSACQTGTAVGASIAVGVIVVFWAFVDVILGILWLVTRPRDRRVCPACGTEAKAGVTVCTKCGYDFAQGAARAPSMPPPPM